VNILAYVHLRNIYRSTGVGRLAKHMVEELHAAGERVAILGDPADHAAVVHKVGAPWTGFDYRFFANGTSTQQALWALFDRPSAESYWPEAEVVYCPSESYVPVRRARLAVTAHDAAFFEEDAHPKEFAFARQRWKWQFLYHKLSQHADRVITVSRFSAERLAHFFPKLKDRFRVVPSAVPQRFFEPESELGRKELADIGLANRRFVMLPRGLHHRKNADLVLRAWPRLAEKFPDLLLVVTSHCDREYVDRAKALGPSVILTDFVDDELLTSIYHAAAVVWFPSLYEGFGLPPLEAMACGTPVVASNTSSLPEVTGGAALLVSPTSLEDNIDALAAVLTDSALSDRLVKAGLERASIFTWHNAGTRLRAELRELA
jgi:glycosyltransferase involved in cell wall biosynthesis